MDQKSATFKTKELLFSTTDIGNTFDIQIENLENIDILDVRSNDESVVTVKKIVDKNNIPKIKYTILKKGKVQLELLDTIHGSSDSMTIIIDERDVIDRYVSNNNTNSPDTIDAPESLRIEIGEKKDLGCMISVYNSTNPSKKYQFYIDSDGPEIVKIENTSITGLKDGLVKLFIKCKNNTNIVKNIDVVVPESQKNEDVTASKQEQFLNINTTYIAKYSNHKSVPSGRNPKNFIQITRDLLIDPKCSIKILGNNGNMIVKHYVHLLTTTSKIGTCVISDVHKREIIKSIIKSNGMTLEEGTELCNSGLLEKLNVK